MKFGLSFLPDAYDSILTAKKYFKNALALSMYADQSEFETIKMTEHYLNHYGGYCPSPLIFLSNVASVTKRIRLMTGCILPAFHHPIQLAAEVAQLDAISEGRLDVGFARAFLPYEFKAFGIDMDSSRYRYEQSIETIKKLWTKRNVSISSDFFKFDEVNSFPFPTQKPHPPIWGAAVLSRQSFAWLGENGYGLLVTPPFDHIRSLADKIDIYYESFALNTYSKPKVAISLPLLIRENERTAIKEAKKYLTHYKMVFAKAADAWSNYAAVDYPGYQGMATAIRDNTVTNMINTLQAFVGTPSMILDKIEELSIYLKVDQILWQVDFGCQPLSSSMTTLKLFNEICLKKFLMDKL